MDVTQVETILRQHNIKPSHHRLQVLQYMLEKRNHPSAEMIYQYLAPEIPTLSRTTVYNTLQLLVEKGVAIVVAVNENETRYDADVSPHGHFKCLDCGSIYDFHFSDSIKTIGLDGFKVTDRQLYYFGYCPHCLAEGTAN
ncbi:MAG: Fur family transcriptional regulator [Methylocystaceae bacterium]